MFGSLVMLFVACSGETPKPPEPAPAPVAPEPPPAPTVEPGKLPGVEFPAMKTTAAAGDFVLVPSRDFLDKAIADGGLDKATFIYYGATMLEPGPVESKVKSLAGTESMMPNSLIIAIAPKQTAKVGDILLGHWESGSGIERAIVVAGGTPEAPKVKYLDADVDTDLGKKVDDWKADRFQLLEAGKVGVTVVCKDGDQANHGILVALTPKKVLSLEFAGKLAVHPTADCMPLDPMATFKAGDKVQYPFVASYGPGDVTKVDAANGRVTVKGSTGEKVVAAIDVAANLDGYGTGFEAEPGMRAGEGKAGKGKADGDGEGEGKAGKGKAGKNKGQ